VRLLLLTLGLAAVPALALATDAPAVIVLDAGHGGADRGLLLSDGRMEKDLTLELAVLLKGRLEAAAGQVVELTRDRDYALGPDERAARANTAGGICLLSFEIGRPNTLEQAGGVRLYVLRRTEKPLLTADVSWKRTQDAFLGRSRELCGQLTAALLDNGVPVAMDCRELPLALLQGLAMPAVVVELLPPPGRTEAWRNQRDQLLTTLTEVLLSTLSAPEEKAADVP
jgi:N-acetylmuramoyl-L-alanine amidase